MSRPTHEDASASGDVSQFDVVEFIGDAFTHRSRRREELVELAWSRGARPAVLDQLRHLPARPYSSVADVTAGLRGLPTTVDPWESNDR